jgi:hypothetical protein
MRKAFVGIVAILTTLVLAIPLAAAAYTPPTPPFYFVVGTAAAGGFELDITSTTTSDLYQVTFVPDPYPNYYSTDVCTITGTWILRGNFLTIHGGSCSAGPLAGAQVSGSGMVNTLGFVVLTLAFQGKPGTSVTFVMKQGTPLAPPPP